MLTTMNTTASFFGDPILIPSEIDKIVMDCISDVRVIEYSNLIPRLMNHYLVSTFVSGKGTVRYVNQ
jgi:hypothetical protein